MRTNVVKQKIKAGQPVFGSFCNLYAPAIVEICGHAGLDFVVVDAEHGPMSPQECEHMVRAAEVSGLTPIVRCAQNLPQVMLRYLDIGALGIHIPMINRGADAEAFVRAAKYHPDGRRGLAGVRAGGYGIAMPLSEYVVAANRETMLVAHIETTEAVDHLPEILAVAGIDVIFIGPTDLSHSLGYPGRPQEPEVQRVIGHVIAATLEAGKVVGTIAGDGESAKRLVDRGVLYLAGGVHSTLARGIKQYLQQARG